MDYLLIFPEATAYTLGIATLIVQVICYLKDIKYPETMLLTGSFLLVIVSFPLQATFT